MRCDDIALELAAAVDGDWFNRPETNAHVQACLRCQAEMVGYRRLRRDLRDLNRAHVSPDEALLKEVLLQVRPPAEVHRLRPRRRPLRSRMHPPRSGLRTTAGFTAGLAGAIAGAAVLASRMLARSPTTS